MGRAHDALTEHGGCTLTSDRLVHRSSFPIELHTGCTAAPDGSAVGAVWERGVLTRLAGIPAKVLDPSDELLALCVHAAATSGRSPQWAADATMLLRAAPPDWMAVLGRGPELRASAASALFLDWLRDELSAPVPEWAIRGLAETVDSAAAGLLLHQARQLRVSNKVRVANKLRAAKASLTTQVG